MTVRAFRHHSSWVRVDPRGQKVRAELDEAASGAEGSHLRACVAQANVRGFVPALALAAKAKRFDDRFVAAMDLHAHEGDRHLGWRALLGVLRSRVGGSARGRIDAAISFVGEPPATDGAERLAMRKHLRDFERQPFGSRPIGFYAESEQLSRLFRHDRFLQSRLGPEEARAFAAALGAEAPSYRRLLRLAEIVTGPRALGSVEDEAEAHALLPPSDSLEGRLIKELFGNRPVPEGWALAEELVARVRDGRLDTTPRPNDGWYAYKQHALAACLTPDTAGLEVGPRYRAELEALFSALFALNRETHVKQLDCFAVGPTPLVVAPQFSVEPLPALYGRTAAAYAFVRAALTELLGEDVLRSVHVDGLDAVDALVDMETLFSGAAATARAELGQPGDDPASRARFAGFARSLETDPDLDHDLRVAVPLYVDEPRQRIRIAATVGLEARTLRFEWVERPSVEVFGERIEPRFEDSVRTILTAITLECDVRVPPTREELRAICDRERDPTAIRAALVAS